MNIASRSQETHPKAPRFILAVLCLVALVGLTQCKMTPDNVTGVTQATEDHSKSRRGDCVSDCAHTANEAMRVESDRHTEAVKQCRGNKACLDAEKARHDAAVQKIQDDRQHCIEGCHHQGGGHGR